ncbi:unnamed protein product [Rotaria magnacalcarata]|uniref:Uncharacterized protein n=5 Tax=Rotaria magnacalcarata TaxID=392030 RepID=A0A816YR84_9BILA|nr:unnamed protein product [Rotaria magnacalcarata]CAF2160702.1 unnamed protein product [Rotaria magnacalcarata]CAF3997103.1 unnamed protein product [Rotaria magnacalcarata]CAF4232212.1 unnamed protein product [Rotaria magnacalcarata]
MQYSDSSITTTGLTGCYGFLIDIKHDDNSFCFLEHHSFAVDCSTQSTLPEILLSLIKDLVKHITETLKSTPGSKSIEFKKISDASLFICGGIQQNPDYIRLAFALLQQPLNPETLGIFQAETSEFYLLQRLNCRTTIIDAVSFLLSDEIEDIAADAGLEEDDLIQPTSVWITYDCRSKKGHLGVRFQSAAGKVDLAQMLIDLSTKKEQYEWQLRPDEVDHFYNLIKNDQQQLPMFSEAMGNIIIGKC